MYELELTKVKKRSKRGLGERRHLPARRRPKLKMKTRDGDDKLEPEGETKTRDDEEGDQRRRGREPSGDWRSALSSSALGGSALVGGSSTSTPTICES
uniref:Uncharacterized protein n=1 Tax=Arundo donax TaxID=35708 RepID=A0A0A9DQ36_ARUDO